MRYSEFLGEIDGPSMKILSSSEGVAGLKLENMLAATSVKDETNSVSLGVWTAT